MIKIYFILVFIVRWCVEVIHRKQQQQQQQTNNKEKNKDTKL